MAFEAPAASSRSDDVEVWDTADERQGDMRTRQMGDDDDDDDDNDEEDVSSCFTGGWIRCRVL
jgi:hypothetical protein